MWFRCALAASIAGFQWGTAVAPLHCKELLDTDFPCVLRLGIDPHSPVLEYLSGFRARLLVLPWLQVRKRWLRLAE